MTKVLILLKYRNNYHPLRSPLLPPHPPPPPTPPRPSQVRIYVNHESFPVALPTVLTRLATCLNPFMPNGFFHTSQWDQSISVTWVVGWYFSFLFNSNRIFYKQTALGDPDQTPHSAASNLGMHCLPISHKQDTMRIWVKQCIIILQPF